jgi:hypothetical protein
MPNYFKTSDIVAEKSTLQSQKFSMNPLIWFLKMKNRLLEEKCYWGFMVSYVTRLIQQKTKLQVKTKMHSNYIIFTSKNEVKILICFLKPSIN